MRRTTVTDSISYNGHLVDTSQATGGGSTSAILSEVCKMISNPVSNGYYPVYVDIGRGQRWLLRMAQRQHMRWCHRPICFLL